VCVCEVYEEQLLSEGLITDNMSQRVVTSLPKCLSDSTMRGSRESLRSSRDSLPGSSTDSLQRDSDDSLHHVSSLGSTGRSASTTALTDSQVSTERQWRRQTRGVGCVRTPWHPLSRRCIIFLTQDSALCN